MKHLSLILLTLSIFLLNACDNVEEPICLTCQAAESDNKILLEEFTGHRCKGCPKAHKQADALKEIYGDNLVIVSIHATTFAAPLGTRYTADYRTPMGDALAASDAYDAGNAGLPKGMVNRLTGEDGSVLQGFTSWGAQIGNAIQEAPKMSIDLESNYISGNEVLEVATDLKYFEAGNPNLQLVLVITEDSIFSTQEDEDHPDGYIENYHHKHVLRASITTGNYGEQIKGSDIAPGEEFSFEHQIPWNSDWNPSNCEVVGYVIDGATKEVWQAQASKIGG